MVKLLIGTGCGIFALGSAAVVYCCLRAGALYDQTLTSYPLNDQGEEDAEYGAESETG